MMKIIFKQKRIIDGCLVIFFLLFYIGKKKQTNKQTYTHTLFFFIKYINTYMIIHVIYFIF